MTASEISGKNVPQKITKHNATSTRLFSRKAVSRDSSELMCPWERRSSRLRTTSTSDAPSSTTMNPRNGALSVDAPKAWIDDRIPERTRNVPGIARIPVASTSETFQIFRIPRFSWTMNECRNAVPVSQGISEAFSTGSHAQ